MVRQSPFSTMIFDASGRLLEVNRAFEEMWGVSAADVVGYNPLEDEQSHTQGMIPLLERAFAGETVVFPEAPYDAAQTVSRGHRRWIKTFAYPVREGGRVSEVVFMHEDVTARREAEEAKARHDEELGGERRRLQDILASVPGVVWEAWGRPDGSAQQIDFVSDHVEEMLGYTREEWLSESNFWLKLVHPEDRAQAAYSAAEHFVVGGAGVNRFRWVAKDGRVLWVESRSRVIADEEGRPLGMRGVTLDVTERRRVEEELLKSQLRLELAQEAGGIGTFDWDILTDEVVWTEQLEALFGLAPGGFGGTFEHWRQRVHAEDLARCEHEIQRTLQEKLPEWRTEYRMFRADTGELRWIDARARAFYDAAGQPTRLIGVNLDVTQQKRAEAERERMLEREKGLRAHAEEANRLKDEFLATVSHELRTPLTAILGWGQMLEAGRLDAETARHAVAVINRNAMQQRQIVEDILDVSRIITGKLRLESETVALGPLVQETLDMLRPAAEAKGIRIRAAFDAGAAVTGDPHRLKQVVWNLLSNALKFTPGGGEVRVGVVRLLTHVRVEVSDTGQGIEQEFLPYVFDRFRQADSSTTRQHGGLGLGLAIVRHLVELHGGSVHAYSAGDGQGATFTVDLPPLAGEVTPAAEGEGAGASERAAYVAREVAEEDVAPPLVGLRVLLVEDDADALEMLAAFLRRSGADVTATASSDAALRELERQTPDVIVSDIAMPGGDGYEFMRRVRALGAERGGLVPSVALTAYASDSDRALALRAGYHRHMGKPFEPARLLEVIADLAGKGNAPGDGLFSRRDRS
jgi:PAS domain S-box-containing protein